MSTLPTQALTLLIALLATTTNTLAQDRSAQELFEEGVAHFDAGRPERAAERFAASYALVETEGTLFNWAAALHEAGQWVEAATVMRRYVRSPTATAARREALRARLVELRERLGRVRIAPGVDDARVLLDGEPVELGPDPIFVTPGDHTVVVEAPGHEPGDRAFRVRAGEMVRVGLRLAPVATEEPVPPVTTERSLALPLVGTGVSVGLLGGGVAAGLLARARWSDAEERCPGARCTNPEDLDLDDRARRSARWSTALLVTGVVALGVTVVLWLVRGRSEPPAELALRF